MIWMYTNNNIKIPCVIRKGRRIEELRNEMRLNHKTKEANVELH